MTRQATRVLKRTFGFDSFRPHQQEIISAVLDGRDLFAALPTGGGKSLCYQLPAMLLPKLTVVVSPLIALMEDQVEAARQSGVPAAYLNSSLDSDAVRALYRDLAAGTVRLLYVSPERLAFSGFRTALADWGVSLFAIDEAHCISEWGHEFRPEYRNLPVIRREFPDTPVAAFTATATPRVQDDVVALLELSDPLLVRGNFDRPEIFYRVRKKESINRQIKAFISTHREEPGIVYRATRKAVEETAGYLSAFGIPALPYHAGLGDEVRRRNQRAFVQDDVQVVVATIAFGMGIDKSNVRWVVHGDLPRSVEAYYQETGRAGRDGEDADTCLFYGAGDIQKIRYHIDRMEVDTEREQAERNLKEVLRFVDAGVCRRTQLLRHFGQDHAGDCGRCDVCTGETRTADHTVDAQKLMSAIYRTGQRFGSHHVVDVVIGTDSERVRELGHQELPTFGVGSDRTKRWWLGLAADLEAAGMVERRDGRKSGLRLTDRGWEVLRGKAQFRTVERPEEAAELEFGEGAAGFAGGSARGDTGPSPGGRGRPRAGQRSAAAGTEQAPSAAWREDQERLFHCLRALRRQLAKDAGVPPYMVFSDKSLKAMVRNRPDSLPALLRVHGVGERKASQYGAAFLDRIRTFLATGECPE